MRQPVFALIDCNNFFVSCERLFRPDLEGKPVVVLSSNDGCVIARSNEAKALGVPMAAPVFKMRHLLDKRPMHLPRHMWAPHAAGLDAAQGGQKATSATSFARRQSWLTSGGVIQFSANFELYGDISRRITDLLTSVTPRIEIYSIDESFLDLSELVIKDYTAWGKKVREQILSWIGIPVSVGIASTKTLAKAAVERAKKTAGLEGVLSFQGTSAEATGHYLAQVPVEGVWGVGRRLAPKLKAEGVFTASGLANMRPQHAGALMGVHGRQMVAELNGISCLPLQREDKPRQSIARTRTFGEDTSHTGAIEAALASFAARAAFRLRQDNQVAWKLGVFAQTNKHKPNFRTWSKETYFSVPTADSGTLISAAVDLFSHFYRPATAYHRAGVYLGDFAPGKIIQTDLFGDANLGHEAKSHQRMQVLDFINGRWGQHTVRYAAEDLGNSWHPKQQLRSPRYTTKWPEIPLVYLHTTP